MSRQTSRKKVDATIEQDQGWKSMLTDVQIAIRETKQRLADLEQSARIIGEKLKTGEPFPTGGSQ
jgi:hypothetical protein